MSVHTENQDLFVAARHERWERLERLLDRGGAIHKHDGASISAIASLYRSLCSDLMRCQAAGYTPDLLGYLNALASRAHSGLYGTRPMRLPAFAGLLWRDFPRALHKNGRLFALSCLLFLLPCAIGCFGALESDTFATDVLPRSLLQKMAENYSGGFEKGRAASMDATMTGFYVRNNIGVAFRCFSTGIVFGLGTIFFLIYNGLMIGTVTGYVAAAGHGHNILAFMCGHGPFELTAIVISGGAGLQMGYALVKTNGRTRLGSLRAQAPDIMRQVVGAAVMLLFAAGIEGFWSPSSVPPPIKWAVGATLMVLVTLYLLFAGRGSKRAQNEP